MLVNSTLDVEGGTWSPRTFTPTIGGLKGSGDLSLPNTGCLYVGGNNQSTTYSGALSGPTQLSKTGSGTLTLSAANTYTGDTQVQQGTLNLANQNAIQNSTFDAGYGGVLTFDPSVSGHAFTIGGLSGWGNLILQDGPSGTGTPISLSVGNNNVDTFYSGNLSGSGSLTKIGSGAATGRQQHLYRRHHPQERHAHRSHALEQHARHGRRNVEP